MKTHWQIREGSGLSVAGVAFSLLALIVSAFSIQYNGELSLSLPDFSEGVMALIGYVFPILTAVLLVVVCIGFHYGRNPAALTAVMVMLFAEAVCRYALDFYATLYVRGESFYPFAADHLELPLTLVLLIFVALTVGGAIRTPKPCAILGLVIGLMVLVVPIGDVLFVHPERELNLSALALSGCGCAAVALCALTMERRQTANAMPAPVAQETATACGDASDPWDI